MDRQTVCLVVPSFELALARLAEPRLRHPPMASHRCLEDLTGLCNAPTFPNVYRQICHPLATNQLMSLGESSRHTVSPSDRHGDSEGTTRRGAAGFFAGWLADLVST